MARTRNIVVCLLLASLCGCASDLRYQQMDHTLRNSESPEAALTWLQRQAAEHPDDLVMRSRHLQLQQRLVDDYLGRAEVALGADDPVGARAWMERAMRVAPGHDGVVAMQSRIADQPRLNAMVAHAESIRTRRPGEAMELLAAVLARQPGHARARRLHDAWLEASAQTSLPELSDQLGQPITVQFRDQPLIAIFELISNITGVGFTFDREVASGAPTTVYARDTSVRQVLAMVLQANQLESKAIDDRTLLIYPKRPDKEVEYRDLVVRTFYLQNAKAAQAMAMIKQMIRTRDVALDERTNSIMLRDTPQAIAVAERLIAALDVAPAEVVIEAQVLEVSATELLQFGVLYPDRIDYTFDPARSPDEPQRNPGFLTLSELHEINSGDVLVRVGPPSLALDMLQAHGRTTTLANPHIRVRNREKARVLIGDRLPIVTTTLSDNFSSESVNYQDVGLSLEVEPTINASGEIQVKLRLEVSNVTDTITTDSGLVAYQIGTRTAETVMTVRNNQTQALAGLLASNEQNGGSGLPGLSRIPILDRIFGTRTRDGRKTELMLLLTPRIVRLQEVPSPAITSFPSGSESRMSIPRGDVPGAPVATPIPSQAEPVGAPTTPMAPPIPPSQQRSRTR